MLIVTVILAYLALGIVFALAFFVRGYAVIAPEAAGAGVTVRLLWLPAAVMLWPLLLKKWARKGLAQRIKTIK